MLHDFLFSPFSDSVRQQQYEQVRDALRADASVPVTLLLGNFAVEEGGDLLDAVVVRPHGITLLVFVPRGGKLRVPALGPEPWQLDDQSLSGTTTGAANPFVQFVRQKDELAAWLTPQFSSEQANLQFISGLIVFAAPVTFGAGVEELVSSQPGGNFQLLGDASQLPRRLKQLARPEIDLTDAELTQWAQDLNQESAADTAASTPLVAPDSGPTTEANKSLWGRAWRWLGAGDIPEDTPYGSPAAQVAASSAEKERLERLQLEAQADVRRQLQALETREAERERSMAELRAQLAQAPPVTTEAQALRDRLAMESQEKAALESAIRTSRAESEARNQDLDAKIQQLGQLIEQLHARPAASPSTSASASPPSAALPLSPASPPIPVSSSTASPPPASAAEPRLRPQTALLSTAYGRLRAWRRRPRLAPVLGTIGLLGLLGWGVSQLGTDSPAPYQENGKWGFAKASGEPVVPARFTSVAPFQQERAVVEENGVYGMIDAAGKEVVPLAYDALNPYADGYARVRVGDMYTFLDEQGQEFSAYYFNALDFSDGYAAVLDHRGWHYITGPEEEDPAKPPVIFREAYAFRDGLARVKLADGYTFITKSYLTDPDAGTKPFGRYEVATDFEGGKAQVTQNGRRFTIDTDGDPVD